MKSRSPSPSRWPYLVVTSFGRLVVGFQFQALPALAPALGVTLGFSLPEIGLLTGLYMMPGVAVAILAGLLLQTYTVRSVLIVALILMTLGATTALFAVDFTVLAIARIVQGTGGVLMIVATLKGIYDRFAEAELAFANAVSSAAHPFGMGLSLMLLTGLGQEFGWRAGYAISGAVALVALFAVHMAVDRSSSSFTGSVVSAGLSEVFRLTRREIVMLMSASAVIALYAGNFHAFLSLLPSYLHATGWAPGTAASIMGVLGWAPIVIAPAGGLLIARVGHASVFTTVCFLGWGGCVIGLAFIGVTAWLVGPMLVFGPLVMGVVMSLGAQAVAPERRGIGSGIFMAGFFLGNAMLPALAAQFGEKMPQITGLPEASAILFCGTAFLSALVPLAIFYATEVNSGASE